MANVRVRMIERVGGYTAILQMNFGTCWKDVPDFAGRGETRLDAIYELKLDIQHYIAYLNRNVLDNDNLTIVDENGGRLEDYEL